MDDEYVDLFNLSGDKLTSVSDAPADGRYSVTEFVQEVSEELSMRYEHVRVEGEVSGLKTSHGKWVFFDLKDESCSVSCFLPVWQLNVPIEDGMKILVEGTPKLTDWGRFSLTIHNILPVGEGSIKKSFELLKKKLAAEGLFDPQKKREIPENLVKIGVISSTEAAGYADFCKILNARWGGLEVQVAHTQVQGLSAPEQIISALKYFNEKAEVQIIAIIRGGGSADDLSAFNDENLARAIASSRIPVITGIGHEVDESLADLAADIRASTPSNVAELLTPSRESEREKVHSSLENVENRILQELESVKQSLEDNLYQARNWIDEKIEGFSVQLQTKQKMLEGLNPRNVLKRGYAIISGDISPGNVVKITTFNREAEAKINQVKTIKEEND